MKPSVRRFFPTAAVAVVLALLSGAAGVVVERLSASSRAAAVSLPQTSVEAPVPVVSRSGSVADLASVMAAPAPAKGALSARFRLAGTILGSTTGGVEEPVAIIDDRELVRQHVVTRSQEVVPGVLLSAVGPDSAVLSGPDGEETLRLVRPEAGPGRRPHSVPAQASVASAATGPAKTREEAAARFGGREVFPDRWSFDREKVISYYEELRAEPERMLAVFDSMDPVYVEDADGQRRIEGYQVGVEGESDLFLAAGLEEGDIVRSVNSVLMARRDRAEALIAAFVEGRASMFVFEVERAGETKKLVFEIE